MTVGLFAMMMVYGGWLVCGVRLHLGLHPHQDDDLPHLPPILGGANRQGGQGELALMETLYGISTVKALGIKETRSSYWLNLMSMPPIPISKSPVSICRRINTFITTLDQVAILCSAP